MTGKANALRDFQAWVWRCARFVSQNMDEKARTDLGVYRYMRRELESRLGPLEGRAVLDVGCGPRFQAPLLFQSFGCRGVGIDTDLVGPRLKAPRKYFQLWSHDGYRRALQVLARDLSGRDRAYYRSLENLAGAPLRFDAVEVRNVSVSAMPFADNSIDAAVSNLVFEHVPDVPGAVRELARVLKPGGVLYFVIHNYTSLSGGHQPLWWGWHERGVPESVPPWDHLRRNLYPSPVYINRLRMGEYLRLFGEHFEILDVRQDREGEDLLTPEIEAELSDYSREELVCMFFHLIARKPA